MSWRRRYVAAVAFLVAHATARAQLAASDGDAVGGTPAAFAVAMQPREANSPLRALVVEDDPSLCDLLTQQLEKAGIDAHGVGSSEEALRWIDENGAPNIVSTDLGLPVLSGFRLCEQLRSRADMCAVPIAVVSARTEIQDQARAMEIGADAFIEKPLGLRRYAETVTTLLKANALGTMLFVP